MIKYNTVPLPYDQYRHFGIIFMRQAETTFPQDMAPKDIAQ
jgi:hypothetical protein